MSDEQIIQQLLSALDTVNDPRATTQQRQQANEVWLLIIIINFLPFIFISFSSLFVIVWLHYFNFKNDNSSAKV